MVARLTVRFGPHDGPSWPPPRPVADGLLYRLCLAGREPAELLTRTQREDLVHQLHCLGWTVDEIAAHTRMTVYTTGRILDRLGLPMVPAEPAVDIPAGA
jgi:hypothetical protein